MSKKANVVASYGDPRKPRRWPAKRIRREFAREIIEADKQPPEASFDKADDMLAWLDEEPDDPRRDCPWKCYLGDPKCICVSQQETQE